MLGYFQNSYPPTIPSDVHHSSMQLSKRLKFTVNSVTQETSAVTPVSVEGSSFSVTTFALTNAADALVSFDVNNSYLSSGVNVQVSVVGYTGTTGVPMVYLSDLDTGVVTVNLVNVGTAVLNGTVTLHFLVTV